MTWKDVPRNAEAAFSSGLTRRDRTRFAKQAGRGPRRVFISGTTTEHPTQGDAP
jgi:hypothetical protein